MLGILLALALSPAAAQEHPCRPVPGVGCWYGAETWNGTVLVYLRGHHPGHSSRVPAGELVASARQAFDFYGLRGAADSAGARVLVTGNSPLVVGAETLAKLEPTRVVVAAHSGGYIALERTLAGLPGVERVVLLDMFYGAAPVGDTPTLTRIARAVKATGAACSGFYTAHNWERYKLYFRDEAPACSVQDGDPFGHNAGVNRCLPAFLAGNPCN